MLGPRLQGRRRHTFWYEIASSPRNDAYYVSADAFYNNGETSGSWSGRRSSTLPCLSADARRVGDED